MSPETREDFVKIGNVLKQDRDGFVFGHAMRGPTAPRADRGEQHRLLIAFDLGLHDTLVEVSQHPPPALRRSLARRAIAQLRQPDVAHAAFASASSFSSSASKSLNGSLSGLEAARRPWSRTACQ